MGLIHGSKLVPRGRNMAQNTAIPQAVSNAREATHYEKGNQQLQNSNSSLGV